MLIYKGNETFCKIEHAHIYNQKYCLGVTTEVFKKFNIRQEN